MERPIFKPVGTPVEQLDTPALVLDLSVLDQNIETLHSFFLRQEAKVRPHVAVHKCPAIAHKQLAAGGTVNGIAVATVGEAEVFAQHGFLDIFVANQVVTPQKIARLCALARDMRVTIGTDAAKNVRDLSEAAESNGVTLNVVVDVHTRADRCGVEPGQPAVALARSVSEAQNLSFAGLMSYEGTILTHSYEELISESRKCFQRVLDTREMIEREGMEVEVVSVGGTHNFEIAGEMPGVTEVPAGSYALMDYNYCQFRSQFRPAVRVMATVNGRPEPDKAISDTGQKAIGADTGNPVVEGIAGVEVATLSAEHGTLTLGGESRRSVDFGDKLWLTPWDIGVCMNLYDYVHAVRDGRLEAIWEVSARGRYR